MYVRYEYTVQYHVVFNRLIVIHIYRHILPPVVTRRASSTTAQHHTSSSSSLPLYNTTSSSLPLYNAPPPQQQRQIGSTGTLRSQQYRVGVVGTVVGSVHHNMPFISSLQLGSYVEVRVTGRASVRDSKAPSWCLGKG